MALALPKQRNGDGMQIKVTPYLLHERPDCIERLPVIASQGKGEEWGGLFLGAPVQFQGASAQCRGAEWSIKKKLLFSFSQLYPPLELPLTLVPLNSRTPNENFPSLLWCRFCLAPPPSVVLHILASGGFVLREKLSILPVYHVYWRVQTH